MRASVRGIGVAVMISTSGSTPLPFSAIRWCRPNRCCSSITASDRSWNDTPSCTSACVPIVRSIAPSAIPSTMRVRSLPVTAPVKSAYVTDASAGDAGAGSRSEPCPSSFADARARSRNAIAPTPSSRAATDRRCWPARTSVGAMIAAWWPDWIATSAACTATNVFPAPTSPCSSTFIGRGRPIASPTASIARTLRPGRLERERPRRAVRSAGPTPCARRRPARPRRDACGTRPRARA